MRRLTVVVLITLVAGLQACAVNPVTGKRELSLVTEANEIQLGQQNYLPMQQSQGGVYDVDPQLSAYVNDVGQRVAAVSDRPLPYEFVVLNNSVPNAWALPGGKIAINRGLLTELETESELAAVLGHEVVHAAARHSAQQMTRATLLQLGMLGVGIAASDSDYAGLIVGSANVGAQLINSAYGRGAELEADKYGMRYMSAAGYDPQGAVSLQETFVKLSEGRQTDWLSGLFASHPPSQVRVNENRRIAGNLPPGGEAGRGQYEAALARTREILPAYEAYDEGRKALAEKDTATAVARAETAIGLFPEEAHFYALRGDARLMDEQYEMAITNYSSAIRRRDDFFYYHLQRGLIQNHLGNDDEAIVDLERSLAYLKTGPAHYALGSIAEKRGDMQTAMAHYREAGTVQGDVANAARLSFARLDIGQNPAAYLSKRCDATQNGSLVVSVRNDAGVPVMGVAVSVTFIGNDRRARQLRRNIRGVLDPRQVASIDTGLGPYVQGSNCPATVVAARIVQ
ncbi:MAG: M48 family metalloprotease [Pseudomonadota bacterium]